MATVDLTVRGAGAFGLSIAWACIRRGARVRVIDPRGVAGGASGGIVGALAPHVPEQWNPKKAFQLESLLMAESWWAQVEAAGNTASGYGRTGRLQPLSDEAAVSLARSRAKGASDLWQARAKWEVIPARDAPFALPSPTGLLIHDTLSARLHPRQACQSLAAAIIAKGGEIFTDGPDQGHVLWATGWEGLRELTNRHTRMVGAGVKGQAALLDHSATDAPQLFIDGLHIIPHADGTTAVGSTTERDFTDPHGTDAQCDALIAKARAALPVLRDAAILARWAGVRPRSRTRAPMLGHHPFNTDQFIANGGFKIAFGMAPLSAEVMADLILDGHDRIPVGFRPDCSL